MWRNLDILTRIFLMALLVLAVWGGFNSLPWSYLLTPQVNKKVEDAIISIGEGKCEEATLALKNLGQSKNLLAYQVLGDIYSNDTCELKDINQAIEYYRKSAANGNCWGNAALAQIAIRFPNITNIMQIPPERNFLAVALCDPDASSDDITALYFGDTHDGPFPFAFVNAMAERGIVLAKSEMQRLSLARRIADGDGFDQNPTPLRKLEN